MTITIRKGELVKTLEFTAKEAGELRAVGGGKYKPAIDGFFQEFFNTGNIEILEGEGFIVPLIKDYNKNMRFGKVLIKDMQGMMETDYHFEPSFIKHPDGTIELEEISMVKNDV